VDSEDLRRRIKRARRGGQGRCSAELREAALAFAEKAKLVGQADTEIAAELGLNVHALRYWRATGRSRGRLVPVAVVAERAPATEVVVECGKLRIRGLCMESLAELLGRLV
jgi:transposase-like protein